MKSDYKSAGVNIAEADRFVGMIKPVVKKTFTKGVLSGIGNFGAFFKPDLRKFKEPVLVSSVDGVGTKLLIASAMNKFDTIGEDLVNHCVNDIAVCGAVPLFFLDYYATGKLISKDAAKVVRGLARGCKRNGCALIGGETAEMPGVYHGNDFDLAGSITGVVEKSRIVNSDNVREGDVLVGLPSDGLHTNGYSLVRKIFGTGKKLHKVYRGLKRPLGEELLRVHRSYLSVIQAALTGFSVSAISHVTGGGIEGNTRRVVPEGLAARINWDDIKRPELFRLIQNEGGVPEDDIRKTLNLGIGLVFIVRNTDASSFMGFLKSRRERPLVIGSIEAV